jgi:hypothetical protein
VPAVAAKAPSPGGHVHYVEPERQETAAGPLAPRLRMIPYYPLTRFGCWEEMLKEPKPPSNAVLRAVWHYGRGLALVATSHTDAAETELTRLSELMSDESMKVPLFSPNTAGAALAPAPEMLAGEIAAARGVSRRRGRGRTSS